jgi:hypothetical protein
MTGHSSLLPDYLEHLRARMHGRQPLPESIAQFCTKDPTACLDLITEALREVRSPNLIQAIGDGLLQNLLNESSEALRTEVAGLLRTNQRFRFAFASGTFSSVDTVLIDEWLEVFQELGTSKQAERKRLWTVAL